MQRTKSAGSSSRAPVRGLRQACHSGVGRLARPTWDAHFWRRPHIPHTHATNSATREQQTRSVLAPAASSSCKTTLWPRRTHFAEESDPKRPERWRGGSCSPWRSPWRCRRPLSLVSEVLKACAARPGRRATPAARAPREPRTAALSSHHCSLRRRRVLGNPTKSATRYATGASFSKPQPNAPPMRPPRAPRQQARRRRCSPPPPPPP